MWLLSLFNEWLMLLTLYDNVILFKTDPIDIKATLDIRLNFWRSVSYRKKDFIRRYLDYFRRRRLFQNLDFYLVKVRSSAVQIIFRDYITALKTLL